MQSAFVVLHMLEPVLCCCVLSTSVYFIVTVIGVNLTVLARGVHPPQANDAYCIFPLFQQNLKFNPIFVGFRFFSSTLILMHLRVMINTYWTTGRPSKEISV